MKLSEPYDRNLNLTLTLKKKMNPAADGIPQVPPVPLQPHPFEILQNAIVAVVWRVNGKKMWFLECVTHYDKIRTTRGALVEFHQQLGYLLVEC